MTFSFDAYEYGLRRLLERLGRKHSRYGTALAYQQRLLENINDSRVFGDNDDRQSQRAEIIGSLNRLALETIRISFNELCELMQGEPAPAVPIEPPQDVSTPLPLSPAVTRADRKVSTGTKLLWLWFLFGFVLFGVLIILFFEQLRYLLESVAPVLALLGLFGLICLLGLSALSRHFGTELVRILESLSGQTSEFPILQDRTRQVLSFIGGGALALFVGILVVFSSPSSPMENGTPTATIELTFTPSLTLTSTFIPSSTLTLTPSPTPSPTSTATVTPTSTSTPIKTLAPTPDCENVKIDYLELSINEGAVNRVCPITLYRSDVENRANLSGQVFFTGPNAAQCSCQRCWINVPGAEHVSIECFRDCVFSIPISDQVKTLNVALDLYGSIKLCKITLTE